MIERIFSYVGAIGLCMAFFLLHAGLAKYINVWHLIGLFFSSGALFIMCFKGDIDEIKAEQKYLKEVTDNFFRRTTFISQDKDER